MFIAEGASVSENGRVSRGQILYDITQLCKAFFLKIELVDDVDR